MQHLIVDAAAELIQPVFHDGQPRSHVMSAVAQEYVGNALQLVKQAHAAHRPCRSDIGIFFLCQHERGTMIALHQPRSHNADHSGVPALPRADNGALIEEIRLFFHLGKSAF